MRGKILEPLIHFQFFFLVRGGHAVCTMHYYVLVILNTYTVRNVQKFTKFLCYRGNVKFDDIYVVE